ncbi:MAG: hypothetical protein B6I28_03215 [Fusobacteriia bacterium 4572_132]|nr:MAG: hypothetical protein B6I28_03215 [Fusobacteriia bacterium 4572_132]
MGRFIESIKGFMSVKIGRAGLSIKLSKFTIFLVSIFLIIIGLILINLVETEISQRNIQIEKHRKTIKNLEKKIGDQNKELEELKEFKKLMDAIQNLSKRVLNEEEQKKLARVVYSESKKYKYNWRMVLSVIMTESSLRANLKSRDPSYGLMQIKYMTAKEVGNKMGITLKNKYELYNIKKNVEIGSFYLFEQILRFKNVKKGIVAYNLGPNKTSKIDKRKNGGDIETKYLKKVLGNYKYLKKEY